MAIQIGLRGTKELKDRLEGAARARGVSLNKEVNDRLTRSFLTDPLGTGDAGLDGLLAVVAAAMSAAGWAAASVATLSPEGAKQWIDNPIAYEQALEAAIQVLRAGAPVAEQPSAFNKEDLAKIISSLGVGFANAILEEATTGNSQVNGIAERERAKALNAAVGETMAARFKAGEPRSPVVVQSFGSNFVLQTRSDRIAREPETKK